MKKENQKNKTILRHKAIAKIIAKYNTTSPTIIVKKLKEDYNINSTRQTVTKDLKKDLENLSSKDIENIKSQMLTEIDTLIDIAYEKAKSNSDDSLKAMRVYNQLFKTKAEVVNKFHQFNLDMKDKERPIYNITIGKQKKYKEDKAEKEDK